MRNVVFFSFCFLIPLAAHACTVCFGGSDSNLQRGFYWGIVLLGSLPFILLTAFVTKIALSSRRNKQP